MWKIFLNPKKSTCPIYKGECAGQDKNWKGHWIGEIWSCIPAISDQVKIPVNDWLENIIEQF